MKTKVQSEPQQPIQTICNVKVREILVIHNLSKECQIYNPLIFLCCCTHIFFRHLLLKKALHPFYFQKIKSNRDVTCLTSFDNVIM